MHVIILGSGSKGNSTLLVFDNKKILIDVGFSYPQMKLKLAEYNYSPTDIDAILITHDHKDHITGLKSFIHNTHIKVYANNILKEQLIKIIDENDIIEIDNKFKIDNINIETIKTSHDAKGSVGFIINDLVYITDTGYLNKRELQKLINKKVYILESNHDIEMLMNGPYPYILKQRVVGDRGHLSNEMCANYLNEVMGDNTNLVVLAHLSETNNTHELAYDTVKKILNRDVNILVASQDVSLDLGEL